MEHWTVLHESNKLNKSEGSGFEETVYQLLGFTDVSQSSGADAWNFILETGDEFTGNALKKIQSIMVTVWGNQLIKTKPNEIHPMS